MPAYEYHCPHCQAVTPLVIQASSAAPAPARHQTVAESAAQVSRPSKAKQRMGLCIFIAYLTFIAAVVIWMLLAVSYGIAPACTAGSDWARATCFFLPTWHFFA